MGWELGRYYTRTRRVGGRFVREYIGAGPLARLVAEHDRLERIARRQTEAEQRRAVADLATIAEHVASCDALADNLADAFLIAAGYRQHNRGEWRKQHGKVESQREDGQGQASQRPRGGLEPPGE
ncbi:MAG: hypothetical protein K1X57_19015 [Gemmataceae bacterium]|nr:hypothetical protein [Gemmataceae bacterium]